MSPLATPTGLGHSGRYCNAFHFREECAAKRLGPARAASRKGGYT